MVHSQASQEWLRWKLQPSTSMISHTFKKKEAFQRADSRSKKNYNPAACGMKTTFTER